MKTIRDRKQIELLAPVGSFESLMAAINAGADAVYFGLDKLNMRARSSMNFTRNDLEQIVSICQENKIKTYLTANIVLYDDELTRMKELVDLAKQYNISAIIASDFAVIQYARSIGVEVHASTQVNVSNYEALKFFAQFADVIVLARELNLHQVKNIHDQIIKNNLTGPSGKQVQLEMFIHGALCMSVSGKCYLSLHHHNFSANRGACLQDCRRAYTVKERESGIEVDIDNEYIMSPKDLLTIHFLNKILDAGVTVLKIEGRARSPEYVKTVTECYNEAIEAWVNNEYIKERIEIWKKKLTTVFNRGFWDGYYLGQKLGEWSEVYGSQASKRKKYIAKGMNYFSKLKVGEFLCEAGTLEVGDEILITGPTTGVIQTTIKEIRVDLKTVQKTKKGDRFSIPMEQTIRRSDQMYKIIDAKIENN
ncbi:MAG: U32 family peptidase [Bacteroidales bacterium]|nr:U32 family peptidase [Bacteroidales bacterium]